MERRPTSSILFVVVISRNLEQTNKKNQYTKGQSHSSLCPSVGNTNRDSHAPNTCKERCPRREKNPFLMSSRIRVSQSVLYHHKGDHHAHSAFPSMCLLHGFIKMLPILAWRCQVARYVAGVPPGRGVDVNSQQFELTVYRSSAAA